MRRLTLALTFALASLLPAQSHTFYVSRPNCRLWTKHTENPFDYSHYYREAIEKTRGFYYISLMSIPIDMSIPVGLCQCGCGQQTEIAHVNDKSKGWVRGQPKRFVLRHQSRRILGPLSGNWRGGRATDRQGYVHLRMPDHPRASQRGYVAEHILIAERALGKPLPSCAEVHHVDENKANNTPSNLVVCQNRAYHALLHKRQRALDACGDPSAVSCVYCRTYDRQSEIVRYGKKGQHCVHPSCASEYHSRKQRERRAARKATCGE